MDSSDLKPLDNPPPGIAHVMLWTACVAVALGFYRGIITREFSGEGFEAPPMAFYVLIILWSPLLGLWMAAPLLMVRRWFLRMPFPRQPGEWALVVGGVTTWAMVLTSIPLAWLNRNDDPFGEWTFWHRLIQIAAQTPTAVVTVAAAISVRRYRTWLVCFAGMSLFTWLLFAWSLAMFVVRFYSIKTDFSPYSWWNATLLILSPTALVVSVIAFIVAVVIDLVRKPQRGWLHYLGVGSVVVWIALYIANLIYTWISIAR